MRGALEGRNGGSSCYPLAMHRISPWFGLTEVPPDRRQLVVLGCPFGGAASGRLGAGGGPAAVRRWSRSAEAITEDGRAVEGLQVVDVGDVADGDGPPRERICARAESALREHPGAFLVALGGDHAVTPPLVEAVIDRHPDLALLLLDAHPDCFPEYEGDPDSHACAVARAWDRAGVDPGRTALVGVRSFAGVELTEMARAGAVVTARDWAREGTAAVAETLAPILGDGPVYVSLDIDVLDPAHAPGTGYPVVGGPAPRALLGLLEEIWRRHRVVALDLVEVAPELDPSEITAAAAAHVLLQVSGLVARA